MSEEARTSRERWQRIEQIYRQALDLGEPAREALLDDACADDAALRHEVESLLACEPAAAGFIEVAGARHRCRMLTASSPTLISSVVESGPTSSKRGSARAEWATSIARATATCSREVALKILPEPFALDPDRLARFRREAQVLAALNHPNIASIYGFEESDGVQALVLELVEGPTLADRLARGPIPLDEALAIARQIAEALEAAHEHGIVHRDLKPANIKLRPDGTVKVLDFGLAKALEPAAVDQAGDVTASPTITSPAMTQRGMILGTAAYMSPEQARGRQADTRSDIWAFGAVLYEMLSGQRAFTGDNVADTLAAVLRADPPWTALPPDTPQAVTTPASSLPSEGSETAIAAHRRRATGARRRRTDRVGASIDRRGTIAPARLAVRCRGRRRIGVVGLTAWMLSPRPLGGSGETLLDSGAGVDVSFGAWERHRRVSGWAPARVRRRRNASTARQASGSTT